MLISHRNEYEKEGGDLRVTEAKKGRESIIYTVNKSQEYKTFYLWDKLLILQ